MRVALVFPPFYHASLYNLPPLGLISIGSALKERGHDVLVLDFVLDIRRGILPLSADIYDLCARRILDAEPDAVAFSVQCVTFPGVVGIAERIRLWRPSLPVFLGGHTVTPLDTQTLDHFPCFDAVVRGEGEVTLRELVDALSAGEDIERVAGVTWRKGREVVRNGDRPLIDTLDTLPRLDYSLVPSLDEYRRTCGLDRSVAVLETGRGCPHDCVYCSQSSMWRRRSRTYSVERLVREMQRLASEEGAGSFLLAYDQFTADRDFVTGFCRNVMEAGLEKIPWFCISRLDTVDRPLLTLMREAGCDSMCYGIDSGSERTLTFIRKRIDRNILLRRVRETTDEGMRPTLSFVIGFPEEEREDIDATLSLALRTALRGESAPLLQLPTVLGGTELHRRYAGSFVREVDTYFAEGIEFDGGRRLPEDELLIDGDPELFSSFYNLPCRGVPIAELGQIARYFPIILDLYPKTFFLLAEALHLTPSLLFGRFMKRMTQRSVTKPFDLSERQGLLLDFRFFLEEASINVNGFSHLHDVLAYENVSVEAARLAGSERTAILEKNGTLSFLPRRRAGVVVADFAFPLPVIVEDLREGQIEKVYPAERCHLLFRHDDGMLEVLETNPFGGDFVRLCDGDRSVEEIADLLAPRFADGMTQNEFIASCRDAAEELIKLKCLHEA